MVRFSSTVLAGLALPRVASASFCCFYPTTGDEACAACESPAASDNWCAISATRCADCGAAWCGDSDDGAGAGDDDGSSNGGSAVSDGVAGDDADSEEEGEDYYLSLAEAYAAEGGLYQGCVQTFKCCGLLRPSNGAGRVDPH